MIDITQAMLLTLVVSILTFLFGLAVAIAYQRTRQKKDPVPEPSAGTSPDSATLLPLESYQPLARLWREKSSGRLVIEQNGKAFHNAHDLPDSERKDLERLADSWLAWQNRSVQVPAAQAPQPAASPVAVTELPVIGIMAPPPNPKKQPVTMVEQVDAILQELLVDSPLAGKRIRLLEHPTLGVTVWVDTQKFNGVEAVTDPQVQQLLRAAAHEWERRQADRL